MQLIQVQVECIPREIPRSNVTLTQKLGAGAFGDVYRGILDESSTGGVPAYPVVCHLSIVNLIKT